MRKPSLLALAVAALAVCGAFAAPAEATHRRGQGWGDPYAYRYEPRGYYPYYNSSYWRPAYEMRKRKRLHFVHPPYFAAWGYPDPYYRHRAWHQYRDGYVRHGHW